MFITKEQIKQALIEEDSWLELTPKERKFFLEYCVNGLDGEGAYREVYAVEGSDRVIKFPGKKANEIIAKSEFQECFNEYSELIKEYAPSVANAHLFNMYWCLACYNIFDFIDTEGNFKFDSIESAKEQLGLKAIAIQGIETALHPKDPSITITTVKFVNREKYMKELAKFSKFLGEESAAGSGMGQVVINTAMPTFDPADDEVNRKRYGLE